jgi:hypothetical protein
MGADEHPSPLGFWPAMMRLCRSRDSIEIPFIEGDPGTFEEVDQFLPKASVSGGGFPDWLFLGEMLREMSRSA